MYLRNRLSMTNEMANKGYKYAWILKNYWKAAGSRETTGS